MPRDEFEAAVDAAEVDGMDTTDERVAKVIAAVRETAKALAPLVTRPRLDLSANGHVLIEGQRGPQWYEGVSVSVSGHN